MLKSGTNFHQLFDWYQRNSYEQILFNTSSSSGLLITDYNNIYACVYNTHTHTHVFISWYINLHQFYIILVLYKLKWTMLRVFTVMCSFWVRGSCKWGSSSNFESSAVQQLVRTSRSKHNWWHDLCRVCWGWERRLSGMLLDGSA